MYLLMRLSSIWTVVDWIGSQRQQYKHLKPNVGRCAQYLFLYLFLSRFLFPTEITFSHFAFTLGLYHHCCYILPHTHTIYNIYMFIYTVSFNIALVFFFILFSFIISLSLHSLFYT